MHLLRLTTLAAAASVGAWLLAVRALDLTADGLGRVDDVVALGAVITGGLVAAWYALTAGTLALARTVHLTRRAPGLAAALGATARRCGAPVLRRAAVVGAGAGIALGTLPASAGVPDDAVPHDLRPGSTPMVLDGWDAPSSAPPADDGASEPDGDPARTEPPPAGERVPAAEATAGGDGPDRAHSPAAPVPPVVGAAGAASGGEPDGANPGAPGPSVAEQGAGRAGRAAPAPQQEPSRHVVRPGDSLWSVAAAHLGPDAGDADIAAEWPRWYSTNRAVVGADPDLIHPGQVLQAPDPKDVP